MPGGQYIPGALPLLRPSTSVVFTRLAYALRRSLCPPDVIVELACEDIDMVFG